MMQVIVMAMMTDSAMDTTKVGATADNMATVKAAEMDIAADMTMGLMMVIKLEAETNGHLTIHMVAHAVNMN